ncbi:MAG: hypothetical protein PHS57_02970 [Alphaproteobacteria bacterium]|nr:hypothetical protein [Alphaproteobacteria bacterium]
MAFRFIDGFDHYTTVAAMAEKWTTCYGNAAPNQDGRRSGSLAMATGGSYGYVLRTIDDQSTWVIGFAFCSASAPTYERTFLSLYDSSGSVQVSFTMTTTGIIRAYRGEMSSLLAAASVAISNGAWGYLEFKSVIADSSGSVEVRLNGATILTFTGDTKNSSSLATACSFRIGGSANGAGSYLIDDLYVCDATGTSNNDFLGDVRVDTLLPTGAGASTQFTPVGNASNYENVCDASSDDDTTYNEADTADSADTFVFDDLSLLGADVFGVQANIVARKDDAGTRTMAPMATIDSTDYAGAAQSLGDSYADLTHVWETNPATSSSWTESDINGAEFGYEVAA